MKKLLLMLFYVLLAPILSFGQTLSNYCEASAANNCNAEITNVSIGSINNKSGKAKSSGSGYADYSSLKTILVKGTSQSISIFANRHKSPNSYFRIYIDYNQDKDFLDEGELALSTVTTSKHIHEQILIPSCIPPGLTRMRVMHSSSPFSSACGNIGNKGEVEDYTAQIKNPSSQLNCPKPVVVNPIQDQTVNVETLFTYTLLDGIFTDPSHSPLSYKAQLASGLALPNWLTFETDTRTFRGTPDITVPSKLEIRVVATNNFGSSAFDDFILNLNHKPVSSICGSVNSIPQIAQENVFFSYTIPEGGIVDPDGDQLTFQTSYTVTPGRTSFWHNPIDTQWLTFDPSTLTFSGTPPADLAYEKEYSIDINLVVNDGLGGTITCSFVLYGTMINDSPVGGGLSDVFLTKGTDFAMEITSGNHFWDPDARFWKYELTEYLTLSDGSELPSWLIWTWEINDTFYLYGNPPSDAPDMIELKLTVEDRGGASASDYFTLYIDDEQLVTALTTKDSGISTTKAPENIKITCYPNPMIDILNLEIEGEESDTYLITVKNQAGKKIFSSNFQPAYEQVFSIDFNQTEIISNENVYFVTVENKNTSFIKTLRILRH